MNIKIMKLWALIGVAISATSVYAQPDLELLKKSLTSSANIASVTQSPIPGLYTVKVNHEILYLSEDGKTLVRGDLFDLENQVSYTQLEKNAQRKEALAAVKDSDKIIFKAKNERYKVAVFTDISCPYCTKVQGAMKGYNDAGITVEYLAFPRGGVGSRSRAQMQRIWCADDKAAAMTNAKLHNKIPSKNCSDTQVTDQLLLGYEIGVGATPTFVLSDGEMLPGFYKPEELLELLRDN